MPQGKGTYGSAAKMKSKGVPPKKAMLKNGGKKK